MSHLLVKTITNLATHNSTATRRHRLHVGHRTNNLQHQRHRSCRRHRQIHSRYILLYTGPRGMDKMITTHKDTTISNDGATILKLLDIEHAAAKILVDIAKSQDNEVGDGTTTVTILAGELLKNAKGFIEDGMNPQIVIRGYKRALEYCLEKLE